MFSSWANCLRTAVFQQGAHSLYCLPVSSPGRVGQGLECGMSHPSPAMKQPEANLVDCMLIVRTDHLQGLHCCVSNSLVGMLEPFAQVCQTAAASSCFSNRID